MPVSASIIGIWNIAIFGSGIALAILSSSIAGWAVKDIPESIYDETQTYRDITQYVLIGVGAFLAAFAVFGFFAFCFRSRCMIVFYMTVLFFAFALQTFVGTFLIIYKEKDSFPVADSAIQGEIENGMNIYCDYIPVDPGLGENQDFVDALDKLIMPLQDLVGEEYCQVPQLTGITTDECRAQFQDPCQTGVVLWVNGRLFWLGIFLVSAAALELLIIALGIYYFCKVSKSKKQKAQEVSTIGEGVAVRILPWAKTHPPKKVWSKKHGEPSEVVEIEWNDSWIGQTGKVMRPSTCGEEELKKTWWVKMANGSWLFLHETLLVLVPDEDAPESIEMQVTICDEDDDMSSVADGSLVLEDTPVSGQTDPTPRPSAPPPLNDHLPDMAAV